MASNDPPQPPSPGLLLKPVLYGSLSFIFIGFSLPIYSKMLGASALTIGGLYTVFTLTILVFRPLVGLALDRLGRKRFLVAGLGGYALALVLFGLAGSLPGLYAARFVQGLASSLLWITVNTVVADLSARVERGKAMGRVLETSTRGQMIGVVIGFSVFSLLPEGAGWKLVFSGYALLALVGAWFALKEVPETRPSALANSPQAWRVSPDLIKLMVIVFTTGAATAMISPIYLIFLQDKFTTDFMTLAWAFFPAGILYSLLPSRLGALSDRFGRGPMMAVGLVGAGTLSLLLPGLPSLLWLAVLYALSSAGWALADPAEAAMVADLAGEDARGRAFGLYDFAGSLGAAIGPLAGGWLYDQVGHAVPFYLNGSLLLLSALWVLVFLRRKPGVSVVS